MMDEDRDHVTKRILKLTLEIIYLLTGEEYALVKKFGDYVSLKSILDPQLPTYERKNDVKILEITSKIIQLLTEEVPLRYEDVTVCFSMEEWEYVEEHKDLYKHVLTQEPHTPKSHVENETSEDPSDATETGLPCTSINSHESRTTEDGSRNTSSPDGPDSPTCPMDCTEEEMSQDGNEKSYLPPDQEDAEDEEDRDVSEDSGEDETNWKMEADYISEDCKTKMEDLTRDCKPEVEDLTRDCKPEVEDLTRDCKPEVEDLIRDCKPEVEDLTRDCKLEVEDLTRDYNPGNEDLAKDCKAEREDLIKDCKREGGKQLKDCKYEDGVAQYYEVDLLKDVKIEVVSDEEWEEEISWWGDQGRDLFMDENPEDIGADVSMNRMVAGQSPQTFYPLCKKGDGSISQTPVLPGETAHKGNPQSLLNYQKCLRTFPPSHVGLRLPFGLPATVEHGRFAQQQKNINTARKTTSDIQTLQNFMSEMNEKRKVEDIPHTELDTLLSKFILLVKRKDGNEYEPHTLRCMVGSIDRYLKEHSYHHTIIYGNSKDFPLTKQSLHAKIKFLKKVAESNPPIRQEALTDDDIENLYKTGTLSMDNPTSLLNMVFFNNGIHFALRTKEQYGLQWGDIKLKIDPRGNQFLEYSDRLTETLENRKNARQMKPRIYATPHAPDRDPVTAFLKYQSFRPSVMMAPDSPFYLAPNVNYNPAFSEWYRSTKIGIQKIRAMMTTMKIRASLPESKKKVSYITKRRLFERLPQHALASSGAMVPNPQQHNLQSFTTKPPVMEAIPHKAAILLSNLPPTLAQPSQQRLATTSGMPPHPSTSSYGGLPNSKRSFLSAEFALQRNSAAYLNNYRYLPTEEPAKRRKPE
ncbi:uncharacterized protein [Engystomops pustulosus]